MNIYEEATVEQKFDEITDLIGYLILDLFLISLKKVARENQIYSNIAEAKWPDSPRGEPF